MKKRLIQIVLSCMILLKPIVALNDNKVVISVGTQCITLLDIENRLKFIALISGIHINDENRAHLKQEAAKMLVQEQLELQEMENNGLSIQADVINTQLTEMAQRIGVLPENLDTFFDEKGIPMSTVRQFLTAQYYWPQYIKYKYPNIVEVSEDRVELMYKEQLAQKSKPRYLVAEIFVPVNTPSEEGTVQKQIKMIHEELVKGAQFPMLAQQFSQSTTARQVGNMGWINLEFLPEKSRNILKDLSPGQITTPLRLDEGYVIYALVDRRLPGESSIKDTVFSVRQIIMNLDHLQEGSITDELRKCKNCTELEATLAKYPFIQVEKSDHVVVQQMNDQLANLISTLKDNTLSEAIRYPQGSMYMWVCGRKIMDGVMSKDEIRYRLAMQNMSQKSRSILNRLSRTIWVDIKDPTYKVN
jgi:peptidyl-prolyl cis-trans isomerase SurA